MVSKVNIINYNDVYNSKKFFYVNDINYTLKKLNIPIKGKKKPELLELLKKYYKQFDIYNTQLDKVIKTQSIIKGYLTRKNIKLRGISFYNKNLCIMY